MRCLILALAAACLALPAWADPLPSLVPTQDVIGTYQFTDSDGTLLVSVEYSRETNVLRLSLQSGGNYSLYDFNMNDAKMVLPNLQQYYEQPDLVGKVQRIEADVNEGTANVSTGGQETIAGNDCTDYTPSGSTNGTVLCVTTDGVILKFIGPNGVSFIAQSLSATPVPPADLQVPPSYTELTAPP